MVPTNLSEILDSENFISNFHSTNPLELEIKYHVIKLLFELVNVEVIT